MLEKTQGRPRGAGVGALAAFGAMVLVSVACAAAEPVMRDLAGSTPTPDPAQSWSVVEISKPSQEPTLTAPTPLPTAEAAESESAPTATPEEVPVISMVIVEDDSQPFQADEAAGATNPSGKYVLVSISGQHLYAYENDQLVYSFVASTGMGNSTRVGSFRILDKIPSAYGANWGIWMPNWMGIYWSGTLENGIHALPILPGGGRLWAGYLGRPISYGCVVLGVDEALQLYDWAEIGTPVDIQW